MVETVHEKDDRMTMNFDTDQQVDERNPFFGSGIDQIS